jgi:hypothetical protein
MGKKKGDKKRQEANAGRIILALLYLMGIPAMFYGWAVGDNFILAVGVLIFIYALIIDIKFDNLLGKLGVK